MHCTSHVLSGVKHTPLVYCLVFKFKMIKNSGNLRIVNKKIFNIRDIQPYRLFHWRISVFFYHSVECLHPSPLRSDLLPYCKKVHGSHMHFFNTLLILDTHDNNIRALSKSNTVVWFIILTPILDTKNLIYDHWQLRPFWSKCITCPIEFEKNILHIVHRTAFAHSCWKFSIKVNVV